MTGAREDFPGAFKASALITLEDVTYLYPGADTPALSGVSLTVSPGERLAIIGASGSGKSTLAKLMAGLLQPTSGRVVREHGDAAIVFQNPETQLIAATVEEDVAIGPENLGLPSDEIRRRVENALATLGISHLAKRPVSALSGGEKQRVAVAGALAMEPKCLILDEATAMLHPQAKRQLEEALLRISARSVAIVQITHDMDEAARADRVALVHRGRLAACGPPDEILSEAELISAAGLEPPAAVQLALALRRRGLPLPDVPLDVHSLADAVLKAVVP
ncbi:MAG: ATP-binding cassette domain-containing protein [Limnochordia bacterium]